MRRFFISPRDISNGSATVSGDLFRHMVKVLRLKAGDGVMLTDGAGNEFAGVIRTVGRESADISVGDRSCRHSRHRTRHYLVSGAP